MRADMRNKITFRKRLSPVLPSNSNYPANSLYPFTDQNSYGEELEWSDFITVWGSVEPILGKELFAAETINSNIQIKFRCMYFEGVTNEMRIKYNNTEYEILSAVNYKNLNREWLLYSKRVDA